MIGLYAAAERVYPAEIRNTGIGWVIGLGRVGAIISPIVGGYFAAIGLLPGTNMLTFAVLLIITSASVWMIKALN